MKKLLLFFGFLAILSVNAQTDEEKAMLNKLNLEMKNHYRLSEFSEALKLAEEILVLTKKTYGETHDETAIAYTNLGLIYREKKDYPKSLTNFQNAVNVYEKNKTERLDNFASVYIKLAQTYFYSEKVELAKETYLKAIEVIEARLGKNTSLTLAPTLELGYIFEKQKDYDNADLYYLTAYQIASQNYGKESSQVKSIDSFLAKLSKREDNKQNEVRAERFAESLNLILDRPIILNGKAIKLYRPSLPAVPLDSNRQPVITGQIFVKVIIDENGKVINAKALSGPSIYYEVCEKAALKSKFTTTLVDGKPAKVSGVIVYNFINTGIGVIPR